MLLIAENHYGPYAIAYFVIAQNNSNFLSDYSMKLQIFKKVKLQIFRD